MEPASLGRGEGGGGIRPVRKCEWGNWDQRPADVPFAYGSLNAVR